jgi:DNA-binding MarR family transcriptional regulator
MAGSVAGFGSGFKRLEGINSKDEHAVAVANPNEQDDEVLRFFLENIDTVPELEALFLFWQHRPSSWTISDLSKRLYIDPEQTRNLLQGLIRKGFVVEDEARSGSYRYQSESEQRDEVIRRAEAMYRREIIRISTLIHSKPSRAIRDFADAFRFTKEKP